MDRKIESTEVEIQANISELQRVDNNAVWDDPNSKIQGLEERLSQMRKNFEEANIRKEWVEARLQEVETQMQQFQLNEPLSNHATARRRSENRLRRPSSAFGVRRENIKSPEAETLPPRNLVKMPEPTSTT